MKEERARGRGAAPGSEGSKGSEGSEGSEGGGIALSGDEFYCRLSAAGVTGFPAGHSHSERSEESWYVVHMRQSAINTRCRLSPTCTFRIIRKNSITMISRLWRLSPFGALRHHLARWEACHWILSRSRAPYESSSLATPLTGALWTLSSVPHDSAGKRREVYSVPRMGESPAQPDKGSCGGPA